MNFRTGWLLIVAGFVVAAAISGGPISAKAAPDDRAKALDYLGKGDDAYRMGDLVQAEQHWQQAIGFCRVAGDASLESQALAKRGEALEMLGQYHDALADLRAAFDAASKTGNPQELAAAAGALGNIYFQTNEPDKARPLLTQSLDLAKQQGLQSVIAASANNLGNLQAATDKGAGAASSYKEALAAARLAGDSQLAVTIETNQARLMLAQGDGRGVLATLGAALDGALALPSSRDQVYALIAIGTVAKPARATAAVRGDANDLAARQALAYKALRAAAQIAEDRHDSRAASLAWGNIGELYEAAHRNPEARQLGDRAIVLAQETDASDILYRWEWLEGRLAKAAGDRDAAIGHYRRAVTALEAVRPNVPVEYVDGKSSYRETVGPLYFELVDLLLQKSASLGHNSPEIKPILTEARDTVETLKTAEVRDYFKEQCLAAPEAKRTAVEQVSGESSRTAILYPILLPDRVELLLSFSDGPQQFTSRVDAETVNETVRRFRPAVETLGKRTYFQPAEQLYGWLIRPLEATLAARHIDTLVVIPDGSLRTIPFAALYDGKQFLVEKYALATAPGLTLMDPEPIKRDANARVLLAGLSQPVQGYAGLTYVTDELSSISKHYGGTVLSNQNFRLGTVEESLKTVPYSVVHLASHGEFDDDPQKTYILTYDSKLTLDDLEDTIKYSEFRTQPLELLTLSACRTAAGDDQAALGLAGVAIKAGARSAVASLWFVSDQASTHLIERFYDHLSSGESKAKAMQHAQLEMIADPRYRHPGYWSPFLVIGNWL